MGDNSRARLPGLNDASLDIQWAQDFASAEVDATLWAVYDGGAAVAIKVRKSTDAIGATNPEYQFNAILTSYTPIDGETGALHEIPSSFMVDGDVTRATS